LLFALGIRKPNGMNLDRRSLFKLFDTSILFVRMKFMENKKLNLRLVKSNEKPI